jgi:NAD(P)-dependent dehydrogenase (short-subunit alcohol dehydrogenase family)
MAGQLEGKVVVVAGGSAGMGLAAAQRFAAEGSQVVVMSRGRERLDAAVATVNSGASGPQAIGITCDIAKPDDVRAAFAEVGERFGKIDVLLNVAGVARIRRIENATDEDIAFVFGVNMFGPIYTTRAAIPLMRAAGGGDIVNVSSEIVDDYMPQMVLYGASKGALDTFTKMMVHELKADNIRMVRYTSGSVTTSFADNFAPGEVEAVWPEWDQSGYLWRVAGPGMPPEWMADAMVYAVTRPRGQMVDVIHVRSFAPGHDTDQPQLPT